MTRMIDFAIGHGLSRVWRLRPVESRPADTVIYREKSNKALGDSGVNES
jgi:hypothetical protein